MKANSVLVFNIVACLLLLESSCSSQFEKSVANGNNTDNSSNSTIHDTNTITSPANPTVENTNCVSGQEYQGMCLPSGINKLTAVYRFIARDTGNCLSSQSNAAGHVSTDRCRPGEDQLWYAWDANGTLLLASKAGASCLAVAPNGDAIQTQCSLESSQRWSLSRTSDGFTQLLSEQNRVLQYGPYGRNEIISTASSDSNQNVQKWIVQTQLLTSCDLALDDSSREVFKVDDFGAVGDGNIDDGPAITAAVNAANQSSKASTIQFDGQKTYRVTSLGDNLNSNYLLDLKRDVVAQGNGATLLLKYPITPFLADGAQHVAMCGFAVDYSPLPFTQGIVMAVDTNQNTFDLLVDDDYALPGFDAPTVTDNSQAWQFGISETYGYVWIESIKPIDAENTQRRIIRVSVVPSQAGDMSQLVFGSNVILPVMGVAHQGYASFYIHDSNDVTLADISAYSIPFFSTVIAQNQGPITISHAELRPLPGSDRLMSGWRDGFHTKDNRGSVLFDSVWVERNHDDAFNISENWQHIAQVISPNQVTISLLYGSEFPKAGDHVQIIDPSTAELVGETEITSVNAQNNIISLNDAISGLAVGQTFGTLESANPNAIVRNSTIVNTGVRLRSPVQFSENRMSGGLLWIGYDAVTEGPIPRNITIEDSYLGPNSYYVLSLSADGTYSSLVPKLISNISIKNNKFFYVVHFSESHNVEFSDNDFYTEYTYSWIDVSNDSQIIISDTEHNGMTFNVNSKIGFGPNISSSDVIVNP